MSTCVSSVTGGSPGAQTAPAEAEMPISNASQQERIECMSNIQIDFRTWSSFRQHTRIAQTLAQSIQLVAIQRGARRVAADRLPHLRGTRRALHRARGLVEFETGGIERQLAELQQAANFRLGIGDQSFVLQIEHAIRILLQPKTRKAQEVDAVLGQFVEVAGEAAAFAETLAEAREAGFDGVAPHDDRA